MKKALLIILFLHISLTTIFGLNVTIMESQSMLHNIDTKWYNFFTSSGHTAIIVPQTTLDNNAFFATTDILIISSGVVVLPSNRVNTIIDFIKTGKPVYLQSEYLMSYSTNKAFPIIVKALGGNFKWISESNGNLNPMLVLGSFADSVNKVDSLPYFWWGVTGIGDCNTVSFLEFNNLKYGFQYVPLNPSFGTIITTSDQDWIMDYSTQAVKLMTKILAQLTNPTFKSHECDSSQIIIPNIITPNADGINDYFVIEDLEHREMNVQIFNRWGVVVYQNNSYQNNWNGKTKGKEVADGTYYYVLKATNKNNNKVAEYHGSLTVLR